MTQPLTEKETQMISDFKKRRQHFDNYLKATGKNEKTFTCPSCGFPILTERQAYEICSICDWEDDGQDDNDADEVNGGPNSDLSLTDSRIKIATELNQLADSLHGKITLDPDIFFAAYDRQQKRMKNVGIKGNTHIDDPLWNEWRKARQLIKQELIEKK